VNPKLGGTVMRAIGVDLHKNMFEVCYLSDSERRFARYSMGELVDFCKSLDQGDKLAVEATGNTRYFFNEVSAHVSETIVVNPSHFKVISESVKKTDKADAEKLAFYLSKGMLPEVRMRDELSSQVKSLTQTRDKLVKLRTSLKNKIHNILNTYGIVLKREVLSSKKGLSKVLDYPVHEISKVELVVIIEQIQHLNTSITKLDCKIAEHGKHLKGYENITSIKGIGSKSAAILLSVIGDIHDFESEKKLHAYFGIVPRVNNSNEKIQQGHITKQGCKLGRTTLVQCTLIAIRYSPYLNAFYQRLKQKKGSGKAIIATSRKLLTIIYNTLKNDWVFEDFGQFVLKQ
jgi:transposase